LSPPSGLFLLDAADVLVLHQQAARHLPVSISEGVPDRAARRWSAGAGSSSPRRPPWPRHGVRGDHDLGEDLHDLRGGVPSSGWFSATIPPKAWCGRSRTRLVGLGQRRAPRHAAGVGVLDDGAGGAVIGVELRHQLERGVGVVDVVVAQLLALMLRAVATPGPRLPSV
jgi:hypothetical protein